MFVLILLCFRYVCISPAEFLFSYRAEVCLNVCFLKIFYFFMSFRSVRFISTGTSQIEKFMNASFTRILFCALIY